MKKKTFVDLFCGCGGFSLGANLAGFTNLLSVDLDSTLTSSYLRNFPSSNLTIADLAKVEDLRRSLKNPKERPTLVIGGPPCQGFSAIGKRDPTDPRNELIWHYFRHVKKLKPEIFILENVEGLGNGYGIDVINKAQDQLPSYYKVSNPIKVNASDFGAATMRPRILIYGYDERYVDDPNLEKSIKLPLSKQSNVREAISDLPNPIKRKDEGAFDWVPYEHCQNEQISNYAKKLRRKPPKNLGWSEAIEKLSQGYISGLNSTDHTADVKKRFRDTQQGDTEPISRYFRLKWELPSRTIRAGTGADKGGFQSARPIHPTQARVITVREAARIQGFPDWFVFHPTKWHSFRMIGNSVSPIMAENILKKI